MPELGDAAAALAAFRRGCPALARRADASGLTRPGDWAPACAAAAEAAATGARAFFAARFTPVAIGGGSGRVTGYFEPEIAGSPVAAPGYATPLYRRPPGGDGAPLPDRAAIMAGGLNGQGLELVWAADPYAAFFLEVQGSGRVRYPDGGVVRIGYAGDNGRSYVAIGKVLLERGALPPGGVTMASILGWLRAHPAQAPALLAANPRVIFFRRIDGDGPVGALGVALTPQVSVAVDPAFVPLGAPLWVTTVLPGGVPLAALMVAQDTGAAIRGANRIDLFRGAGARAEAEAGALAAAAEVVILLPKAAAARLGI